MISNLIKSVDWKAEKHILAITLLFPFKSDEPLEVEVAVGKGILHPNTVEHHIAWITLYYVAEGSQLLVELARAGFAVYGPNIFTELVLKTAIKLPKSGTIFATSYCSLHGLWEGAVLVN